MFKKLAVSTAVLATVILGGTVTAHADEFGSDNPNGQRTEYIVQSGDTLQTIAWKEGFSLGSLALVNGIENWNHIEVGQKLVLDYTPTIYDEIAINKENELTEQYGGFDEIDDDTYNYILWTADEEMIKIDQEN